MTARAIPFVAATLLLLARPLFAFHTVFDFTVDHFEVDGNAFGPLDGQPDLVNDFDSQMYPWFTAYGTSSLAGGRLHVQSPGRHFPGPDGTTLDLTEVVTTQYLSKTAGDFVATAVFDPIVPPEGHFYHFTVYTFGGGATYFNEIFGLDIHTMGGETRIEQHLVVLDLANAIYETVTTEGHTVTAADLTGQMHFRVAYDGASSTIRSSFSLDGGATFESPFSSVPIFTEGRTSAQFLLGADPHVAATATTSSTSSTSSTTVVPTTTVAPTTSTTLPFGTCERTDCVQASQGGLAVRIGPTRRTIAWSWRRGPALPIGSLGNPMAAGGTTYAICIRDDAGALVFRQEVAPGGTCAGRPCWRTLGGRGFVYKNARAADALGVLRVVASGRTGSQVAATLKGSAAFAPLPPASPLTLQLEATSGACFSATLGADEVTTRRAGRRPARPGY
jgi:hypothetical protein